MSCQSYQRDNGSIHAGRLSRRPQSGGFLRPLVSLALFVAVSVLIPAALFAGQAGASTRLDGMALWDIVPDESTLYWSAWPVLGLSGNFLTVGAGNYDDGILAESTLEFGRVAPVQLGGRGGWVAIHGAPYFDAYRAPDGSGALFSREVGGTVSGSMGLMFGPRHGFSVSLEAIPWSVDGGASKGRTLLAGPGFIYRADASAALSGRVMGATYSDSDGYSARSIQVRTLGLKRSASGAVWSMTTALDFWAHRIPTQQGFVDGREYVASATGGVSKRLSPRFLGGAGLAMTSEKRQIVSGPVVDQRVSVSARVGGEYRLTRTLALRGGIAYPIVHAADELANPLVNVGIGYASGSWRVDAAVQNLAGAIKAGTRDLSVSVTKTF